LVKKQVGKDICRWSGQTLFQLRPLVCGFTFPTFSSHWTASVGLISWLWTVYWTYLLIGFYVFIRFLSGLVIPTCGSLKLASSLVNFSAHSKIGLID